MDPFDHQEEIALGVGNSASLVVQVQNSSSVGAACHVEAVDPLVACRSSLLVVVEEPFCFVVDFPGMVAAAFVAVAWEDACPIERTKPRQVYW